MSVSPCVPAAKIVPRVPRPHNTTIVLGTAHTGMIIIPRYEHDVRRHEGKMMIIPRYEHEVRRHEGKMMLATIFK